MAASIDEKINRRAATQLGRIDPRTCRPDAAYPKAASSSVEYVHQFSEALGLTPAPTQFGERVVII